MDQFYVPLNHLLIDLEKTVPNAWYHDIAMLSAFLAICEGNPPVNNIAPLNHIYRKTSDIRYALMGNKIVDHSDIVGASPVGAAPTTSSFST